MPTSSEYIYIIHLSMGGRAGDGGDALGVLRAFCEHIASIFASRTLIELVSSLQLRFATACHRRAKC